MGAGWLAAPDVGPIYASPRRRWKLAAGKAGLRMPRTALHHAAQAGDPNLIRQIVAEGRRLRREAALKGVACSNSGSLIMANEPDALGRTPLHVACNGGSVAAVQELLNLNADPKRQDSR